MSELVSETPTVGPVVRRGETADGTFSLVITPETAGWGYSSLRVLELPAGGNVTFDTREDETVILPLSGSCAVACEIVRKREPR